MSAGGGDVGAEGMEDSVMVYLIRDGQIICSHANHRGGVMAKSSGNGYLIPALFQSGKLAMGYFTTVSRAMRFYDEAEGVWAKEKQRNLKFIG